MAQFRDAGASLVTPGGSRSLLAELRTFAHPSTKASILAPTTLKGMDMETLSKRLSKSQRFALLLAYAGGGQPVRGKLHFQKEMFLIAKNVPDLADELGYEPALKGPMSEALEWSVDQLESVGLLTRDAASYRLTNIGKICAQEAAEEVGPDVVQLVGDMKALLNDLSKDELLAVVYFLYPEMTVESEEIAGILPRRKSIALRLFVRGKLGLERAAVVAGIPPVEFVAYLKRQGVAIHSE